MKEFVLEPTLSLSKYKYISLLFEHDHSIKSYFNFHKRWERKVDLAGIKWAISIWTFNIEFVFIADKRCWNDSEDKWEKGSEEYFKA